MFFFKKKRHAAAGDARRTLASRTHLHRARGPCHSHDAKKRHNARHTHKRQALYIVNKFSAFFLSCPRSSAAAAAAASNVRRQHKPTPLPPHRRPAVHPPRCRHRRHRHRHLRRRRRSLPIADRRVDPSSSSSSRAPGAHSRVQVARRQSFSRWSPRASEAPCGLRARLMSHDHDVLRWLRAAAPSSVAMRNVRPRAAEGKVAPRRATYTPPRRLVRAASWP